MRLLAIDPGSNKCGLALFNNGKLQSTKTIEADGKDPLKRRLTMIGKLQLELTADFKITSEEPLLMGRNNNGMQRLLGMIELLTSGLVHFIHPMTVKKAMGSGTLDKLAVALAAGEKLSTEPEKEMMADIITREAWDESDAIAIGLTCLGKSK